MSGSTPLPHLFIATCYAVSDFLIENCANKSKGWVKQLYTRTLQKHSAGAGTKKFGHKGAMLIYNKFMASSAGTIRNSAAR